MLSYADSVSRKIISTSWRAFFLSRERGASVRLWRTGVGGKGGAVLVCQVLVDARQPLLHRYFELLNACTVIVKHQHFTDRCGCVWQPLLLSALLLGCVQCLAVLFSPVEGVTIFTDLFNVLSNGFIRACQRHLVQLCLQFAHFACREYVWPRVCVRERQGTCTRLEMETLIVLGSHRQHPSRRLD